jgi:hypothetical protein
MRIVGGKLWLSENDTYNWAHRDGASWPCSTLSGKRLFAEFDNHGNLVDMAINGGRGDQECDGHEFNAITNDAFAAREQGVSLWRLKEVK